MNELKSEARVPSHDEARVGALLRGILPANAAGALQRILELNLAALAEEHDPETIRCLLDERCNPGQGEITPVGDRARLALAQLAELVDADTALADSSASRTERGRRAGGVATGKQRTALAKARHDDWCAEARYLIAKGHDKRSVARIISGLSLGEGADVGTIRRALKKCSTPDEAA